MVHYKKFDNGLRLIVKQMPGLLSVTMGIIVKTGANIESDKEDGISHFIEHMMFKGTKKRTAFMISDEMDRIGAQMNAFTGKDVTCYYAKSTTAHAGEAFDILSDLFLNSTFPEEEMAREKKVIVEEINMNEDTPDDLCLDMLSKAFYGEKGYGRNILGPRENVLGFTKSSVDEYMKARYTADNIVISMAGNIDISYAEKLCEKYFSCLPQSKCDERKVEINLCGKSLFKTKDIEQVHIGLAYPSVSRFDKYTDATLILNSILGGSMSSRLFQKVREELGLAYTVYSYLSAYDECGSLIVYAGVNSKNYLKSVEAIYDCINAVKNKNISEEEFVRGKEQLTASQVFAQESTSSQMLLYGRELINKDSVYNFEERIKNISKVTLNDVYDAIDLNFSNNGKAAALVGKTNEPLNL
ncbi:MAG: insulinase family protein [Clostridiales bacterium]|nr:insulinase family protein [Clostridiales bacterium]